MRKDNKIKKMQRRGIVFSIITGISSVVCVAIVVACIFVCFTGYVFAEIYSNNAEESRKISEMVSMHMEASAEKVDNYAKGISKYVNEGAEVISNEELGKIFNIVSSGNGFVNLGIKLYDENMPNIGTLAIDVTKTTFYKSALQNKYGIGNEVIDGNSYLTYTSPIYHGDNVIGVLYATERGELTDLYYNFIDDTTDIAKTGIRVCYIIDDAGKVIAYCGNGSTNYICSIDDKLRYTLNDEQLDDLVIDDGKNLEMFIESASTKFGIVGEKFRLSLINSWFSDYNSTYGKRDKLSEDIELSNIWYKRKITLNEIEGGNLYTWVQVKTFVEYETVVKLVYASFICLIILLIPFLLMLVSTISKVRSNRKMAGLLYIDTITGYGNWNYFEERAGKILKKRNNRELKFAMISFEISKYRVMLDYYGDGFEEEVLGYVSLRLKKWVGKNEVYARYAESQYGMLLRYDDEKELVERVKKILDDITAFIVNMKVNFKAGIYLIEDKNMSISILNLIAIGAKDSREDLLGNRITMYSSKIREQQRKESMIEESMESALKNKEYKVYLQPKYSPVSEELLGAEALVRWISDEKGFISPGEFIPIFEKNGFVTKLDDYMLDAVAKLQSDWKSEGRKIIPISVNVSRLHFADANLAEHIKKIVDKYDIEHKYIEIELTESAFFDDKEVLLNTIGRLHEYGFTVSMDDFGSGYSSLNSLKNLPLDVIKLDGEFFNEFEDKERGETVIKNTIVLAKDLNMKIVAEGIETKEQVDFLEKQGCDLIQGFYYARPMPVSDFGKLI